MELQAKFDIEKTLGCGQVFRCGRGADGAYRVSAGGEFAKLFQTGDSCEILCTNADFFANYFDLLTNYDIIDKKLYEYPELRAAADFGKGMRILRQEKFETLISFIVSANNNIPRIQKILSAVCRSLGEKREFEGEAYYAFPAPEIMANADEAFYRGIGAGYRAAYLRRAARSVADGFDLEALSALPTAEAEKKLTGLYGVGKKVAGCVLLFAYNRTECVPVDTWIEKAYRDVVGGTESGRKKIGDDLCRTYGAYAGFAQQYLFYYRRNGKKQTE
jgi:N-glycosylase/DNA lyase